MTVAENIFNNLLTLSVLIGLGLLIYCKATGKTLLDVAKGVKEIFTGGAEESADILQGGFESIR